MKINSLKVLDGQEITTIHQHSLEVLSDVGIKVELKKLRDMLRDLGCAVDEDSKRVRFRPDFVENQVKKAPREFILCGAGIPVQIAFQLGQTFGIDLVGCAVCRCQADRIRVRPGRWRYVPTS